MRRLSTMAMSVAFVLASGILMNPSTAFAKEALRTLTCAKNAKYQANCPSLALKDVSLVYILEMMGSHSLVEIHFGTSSLYTVLVPSTTGCSFSGMQDANVS
jgi:hypothetical protein